MQSLIDNNNNSKNKATSKNDFNHIKTWLFVPATKMDRVAKAFASGADAVIVDLEDAVAPEDKVESREALRSYYDSQDYQPIWVRINQAGSVDFEEDLKICQQMPNLAGVILPKAERASDIEHVHNFIGLSVIALVESAVGLYQIDSIAKASGLVAFSYGFLDLCNDLQVQVGTAAADVIANQIRYQLLLTSKVHQLLPPIDTVYTDFNDDKGLGQRVQLWSQIGMSGMLCIHPKQVAIVQQSLQPTDTDIEFAQRVVEEYQRSGQAVFKIDGNMVDAPVIKRCLRLLGK